MKPNAILVRYAEVFLKRGRRGYFIGCLKDNLALQVRRAGPFKVREVHGFLLVVHADAQKDHLPELPDLPALREAVARTFGVVGYAACRLVPREISVLERETAALADEDVAGAASFRVSASRSDKAYPLDSMELNRRLGAIIAEKTGAPVRLRDPAVTVCCHILKTGAVLSLEDHPGPGGLPVGCSGRVALLLSGGLDSPVAGWLAMRRGCILDAIHFEAAPYTTPEARGKVEDLARLLARHERALRLYVVPFGGIQAALREGAPGPLLVVLYRRMMMRIASRIAAAGGASALVTGENLGQVASQTLTNLGVIEDAADRPVLRPLLTYDKMETVAFARRIGTYPISIRPYDDCCSLFVPPHPETAADLAVVRGVEARFPVDRWVDEATAATEVLEFSGDDREDQERAS